MGGQGKKRRRREQEGGGNFKPAFPGNAPVPEGSWKESKAVKGAASKQDNLPPPDEIPAAAPAAQAATPAAGLSQDVRGLRFMQTAQEVQEHKRQEQERLRYIAEMQWVLPGFEEEVAEAEAATASSNAIVIEESSGPPPPLLLQRRSFKGCNPVVEAWVKQQRQKHAAASKVAEEVTQANTLQKLRKKRKKRTS
mmetsp:Transcript_51300/g.121888  ORF Transcript_51300/g.121888 Transcript_51300/m.121888 type:complete len:195 (-) Transcript_51300:94-678(-)